MDFLYLHSSHIIINSNQTKFLRIIRGFAVLSNSCRELAAICGVFVGYSWGIVGVMLVAIKGVRVGLM